MADIKSDRSEVLHYDNPDFPVFIRKNYIPYNAVFSDMSIHWHDELEFIYVLKGNIGYLVDGEKILMKEGEGIFVNSRHLHVIKNGTQDCVLLCIIFHPMILCSTAYISGRMVEPILGMRDLPYLLLSVEEPWQKAVLCHLKDIYEYSVSFGKEMEIMVSIYRLWDEIYQNLSALERTLENAGTDGLSTIKRMIEYIQENYEKKITLNDLCHSVGIGKNKCTGLFARYTNMSPMQYLGNYRIEKGKELLKNTDMSITEIAYATGFSGASYFTETLRKHTGFSAREIRKMKNQES